MFQGLGGSKFGATPSQGLGLGGGGLGGAGTGLGGAGTGLGGGGLGGGGIGIGGTGTSTGVFNTGTATGGSMFKTGGLGGLGGGLGGTGTGLGGTGTGLGGGGLGAGGMLHQTPQSQSGMFSGGLGGGGGMFQTPSSSSGFKFGGGAGLGGGGNSSIFGQSSSLGGGASIGSSMSTPLIGQASTANTFGIGANTGGGLGMGLGGGMGIRLGGGIGGAGATAGVGTPNPFTAVKGTDTMLKGGTSFGISTILHCITAMKEYEQKSLEELRYEDYECGRKGRMGGVSALGGVGGLGGVSGLGGGGMFNQSGGIGGGTSTSLGVGGGMFSQNSGLMGGTSKSGMFSNTGTGLGGLGMGLGNQGGGLVGTSTGLMGTTGIGANQNPLGMKTGLGTTGGLGTGLGGLNASQSTGLGMGLGGSGLGGSGLSGGGGLGANIGLGTSGIGTGLTGGMGTGLTGGIGTGLTGGMGTGLTGSSLGTGLGVNKQLGLGTSGMGTGIGGGLGTQSGLGMGGLSSNTGLGMGQSKLGTTGLGTGLSSNFGMGLGAGTGFPGMGTGGMGMGQPSGMSQNPLSNLTAQQQQAQLQQQIEILQRAPFGDSPLFRNSMSDSDKKKKPHEPTPVSYKITPTASPHYKLNIRSSTKCKPMSYNSPGLQKEKSKLFEGLDDSVSPGNDSFTPRSSIKKLTIKPRHKGPSPHPLPDSTSISHTQTMSSTVSVTSAPSTPAFTPTMKTTPTPVPQPDTPYSNPVLKPKPIRVTHSTPVTIVTTDTSITTTTPTSNLPLPPLPLSPPTPPPQLVLTKDGYYTNPPLAELKQRIADGDSTVENFIVGRKNHGEILFIGKTDVQGLNLDELVVINPKEVSVYPDECADSKPPVGSGLNKKAQVRLEGYWPVCKTNRVPIKDPDRLAEMDYVGKLRKSTEKIGAHFIDYIPDKGTCIFEVDHFSKYKLVADDSEDESDEPAAKKGDSKGKAKTTKEGTKNLKKTQVGKPPQQPVTAIPLSLTKPITTGLGGDQLPVVSSTVDNDMLSDDEDFEDAIENNMSTANQGTRPLGQSFQLAQSIGLDSHQMQLMKASFFDEETVSDQYQPLRVSGSGSLFKPSIITSEPSKPQSPRPSLLSRPQVTQSIPRSVFSDDVSVVPSMIIPKPMRPQTNVALLKTQPHTAPLSQPQSLIPKYTLDHVIPLERSLSAKRISLFKDAGHFMGRSFRVGWGNDWSFVHSGYGVSPDVTRLVSYRKGLLNTLRIGSGQEEMADGLKINVIAEKIDATPWMKIDDSKEKETFYEPLLKAQLKNSSIVLSSSTEEMILDMSDDIAKEIPLFESNDFQGLLGDLLGVCHSLSMECEPQLRQQLVDVFTLVDALWGGEGAESSSGAYAEQSFRRKRLSSWLRRVNHRKEPKIDEDMTEEVQYLQTLLCLLAEFNLAKASIMAHKHSDHQLALLIAHAVSGDHDNRLLLQQQLLDWDKMEAHVLMNPCRLLVYVVLAGLMVWDGNGLHINTCDALDWRQALGLHLWYSSNPVTSIKDVLSNYTQAFKNDDYPYAAPPIPPYLPSEGPSPLREDDPLDTCYHLLRLFCARDYSMELTLSPAGSTPYQLDYRLSWHLWSVLSSIGYNHAHKSSLASLHCSYSAQLESLGAWHWAVFIAQHIEDPVLRCSTVMGVVNRHCSSEECLTPQEQFVINELSISRCIVYRGKAQRAQYDGQYSLQALHLVEACQWNDAHDVIIKHVAPQAIKTDDVSLLMRLLDGLVKSGNNNHIHDWDTMGSVYYDYMKLLNSLQKQSDGKDLVSHEIEELYHGLHYLAPRLSGLPADTPDQCLSRTEMSKNTATFLRTILTMRRDDQHNTEEDSSIDLVATVSCLPMPEEFISTELRILSSL